MLETIESLILFEFKSLFLRTFFKSSNLSKILLDFKEILREFSIEFIIFLSLSNNFKEIHLLIYLKSLVVILLISEFKDKTESSIAGKYVTVLGIR